MAVSRQYIVGSQPYSVYVNENATRQYIVADVYINETSSLGPITVAPGMVSANSVSIRQNIKITGY